MHWNFLLFVLVFNAWIPLGNMGEEVYLIIYTWYIFKKKTITKSQKRAKLDHEPHIKKHPSNKSNSKGENTFSG